MIIILVHGTWGRGLLPGIIRTSRPRWFEEGSTFRTHLLQAMGANTHEPVFEPFHWSGANSLLEREEAGLALAKRLRQLLADWPNERVVLVSHSHGGNVVAIALRNLPNRAAAEVVTLATPFTTLIPRDIDRQERAIVRNGALAALCAVLFYTPLSWALAFMVVSPDGASEFVKGALLMGLIMGTIFWLVRFVLRWFTYSSERASRLVNASQHGWIPQDRLLVLRAVDDEAALSLAAGSIANRLSRVLSPLTGLLSLLLFLTFMLFLGYAIYHATTTEIVTEHLGIEYGPNRWQNGLSEAYAQEFLLAGAIVISEEYFYLPMSIILLVLVVLLFTSLGLAKSVYGRELALRSFAIDLDAQSSPDSACETKTLTLSRLTYHSNSLRHALYDHPDAGKAIAEWLQFNHRDADRKSALCVT
ncbi:MAG: alpha/beta hydrolase [Mesorhizobium sp.]|nr:MAG: alpha/beta hydrolase [Mesorhizobium sp.]TIL54245.1 MAG: alpha/beta hydrolase [Mesorhizobium sp.]